MRIGYVAEPYEESHASGMGYAVIGLLKHLLLLKTQDEFVVYSSSPITSRFIEGKFEYKKIPHSFAGRLLYFFRLQDKLDVCLFVAPFLPLILPRRIQVVMVCKELVSQKNKVYGRGALFAFVRDRILMPISLKRAVLIVTPSQATKDDLIEFYAVPEKNVIVTYEGFQDLTELNVQPKEEISLLKPFFFFTGKVKHRKNVDGIVAAFIAFKKRVSSSCKLVIGGSASGAYYEHIREMIKKSGYENDIIFAGYVSTEDLYLFYTNALALVFPSFNEGFGMPILESMSLGTSVITSNISSMAEIAGDAALLVNPHKIDEISQAMERLYVNESLRHELSAKGKARAQQFSWPQVARAVMDVVHQTNTL